MRRLLLLLLVVPAMPLLLVPAPAFACSCAMASATEYVDRADVVVFGAVEEVLAETGYGHDEWEGLVRLRVDGVLKGAVPAEIDVVNGGCNGAALAARQHGVFFLHYDGPDLRAELCGGSGFVNRAEVIAATGPPQLPAEVVELPSGERQPVQAPDGAGSELALPLALGVGASLVVLAGFRWIRLRMGS